MTTTTVTLTIPPRAQTIRVWAQRMVDAATRAEELVEFGRDFFDRSLYDSRVIRNGMPVDGEFVPDWCPMFRKILYGSEEERRRGMFISPSPEEDGTEFSYIRPYTMSVNLLNKVSIPSSGSVRVDDVNVSLDPRELPYQALVSGLGLQPCSHIFIVNGFGSAEHALFFFPLMWKDSYLTLLFGGRYYEQQVHFFQGDPAAYASTRKRMPRDWDEFASASGDRPTRENWPLQEAPTELAMTADGAGQLVNPRPVELRDIGGNAIMALMRGGWLTNH